MFLCMDQLLNLAAKWRYMFGNRGGVPVVFRGIVGRGWGQGATHSQSLQSVFAHFPGLYVGLPASPADAKGMLVSALQGSGPVVLLENRALYDLDGEVPEGLEAVPFGKGRIVRPGTDVTIVGVSLMAYEAARAADILAEQGVSAEVVDLRSVRPLDEEIILRSLRQDGAPGGRGHELGPLRGLRRGGRDRGREGVARSEGPGATGHAARLPGAGLEAAGRRVPSQSR